MLEISIHALRVEGDMKLMLSGNFTCVFLSTPSGWRATSGDANYYEYSSISIHALRVEGDSSRFKR